MKRVVITGLGVVTPVGNDVPAMWAALLAGTNGVGRITSFDPSSLDSQIAAEVKGFDPSGYLTPKEIKRTERFVQFAVAAFNLAAADWGAGDGREGQVRCAGI